MKNLRNTFVVLFVCSIANASSVYAQDSARRGPPQLSDSQKACFTDNGLDAPGPGSAPPSSPPDKSTMDAVKACLKDNGLDLDKFGPPPGGRRPQYSYSDQNESSSSSDGDNAASAK